MFKFREVHVQTYICSVQYGCELHGSKCHFQSQHPWNEDDSHIWDGKMSRNNFIIAIFHIEMKNRINACMKVWMYVCVYGKNAIIWSSNTHSLTPIALMYFLFILRRFISTYIRYAIYDLQLQVTRYEWVQELECVCKIHYTFRWKMLLWHWQTHTISSVYVHAKKVKCIRISPSY